MANTKHTALSQEQIKQLGNLGQPNANQVKCSLLVQFLYNNGYQWIVDPVISMYDANMVNYTTDGKPVVLGLFTENGQLHGYEMHLDLTTLKLNISDADVSEEQKESIDLSKEWVETLYNAYDEKYLTLAQTALETKKADYQKAIREIEAKLETLSDLQSGSAK